jgi:hypothetical protein
MSHLLPARTLEFTKESDGHFTAPAPTDYNTTYIVELTRSNTGIDVHISPSQAAPFPHSLSLWLDFESSEPGFSPQPHSDIHTFNAPEDRFSALVTIPFDLVENGSLTVSYAFTDVADVGEDLGPFIELLRDGPSPSTPIQEVALSGPFSQIELEDDWMISVDLRKPYNISLVCEEEVVVSGHRITPNFGEKWIQKARDIRDDMDEGVY